ncbi:MAG: hypothetical protein JNJ45_03130 [Chthonomonas sp.]|nr:hypothetical protein [Chthonomonas sp.]
MIVSVGLLLVGIIVGHGNHDVGDHSFDSDHGIGDWLPILSFRFWVYGVGAFGLTGVLATLMNMPEALIMAIAAGVITGLTVSIAARQLARRGSASGSTTYQDLVSRWGTVSVPIRSRSVGKVVVQYGSDIIEVQARALNPDIEILPKEKVILVGVTGEIFEVVAESEAASLSLGNSHE